MKYNRIIRMQSLYFVFVIVIIVSQFSALISVTWGGGGLIFSIFNSFLKNTHTLKLFFCLINLNAWFFSVNIFFITVAKVDEMD